MELIRHETFGIKDSQKNNTKASAIICKSREPDAELSPVRTV